MIWPDVTNGVLEIGGAGFQALNVQALRRDRQLRGVSWLPCLFFTTWSLWNMWYYPHLGQWFSTIGATLLVVVNLYWLLLAWRYRES